MSQPSIPTSRRPLSRHITLVPPHAPAPREPGAPSEEETAEAGRAGVAAALGGLLVELGVPRSQIPVVDVGGDAGRQVLLAVDAELVAGIERLQRARADVAANLREDAPAAAPAGFEAVASRLSEADRAMPPTVRRCWSRS